MTAPSLPRQIGRSPGLHGFQHGVKALSKIGKGVFHLRGHDGVNRAADQAVGLQLAQLLGEHLGRGAGDGPPQPGKTERAVQEAPEDQPLVLAADELERGRYGEMRFQRGDGRPSMIVRDIGLFGHRGILRGTGYGKSAFLSSAPPMLS